MFTSSIWRAVALVVGVVMALSACGGDDAATTTVDPSEDVVFGSGSLPESMPSDFPVPAEAVIGSTLMVRSAGTTEVIMRLPVEVPAAASYFEQNLDARGFDVTVSTSSTDSSVTVEIARDDLSGTIDLRQATPQVTEAIMRFTSG